MNLVKILFNLCFFRGKPQQLPYDKLNLVIIFILSLGLNYAIVSLMGDILKEFAESSGAIETMEFSQLLPQFVISYLISLVVIYSLLSFKRLSSRFMQTATAILGTSVIVSLFLLICLIVLAPLSVVLLNISMIAVGIWQFIIIARVFMFAMDVQGGMASIISMTYFITTILLNEVLLSLNLIPTMS